MSKVTSPNSKDWGLGAPAGVSGTPDRGAVGTVAPAGRLSALARAASCGYGFVGVAVAIAAVVVAPWGLLLLGVTLALFVVAMLLRIVAAGLAT